MPEIELDTLVLVRALASGDAVVVLAGDPNFASHGEEEDALLEARMFLSEHLASAEPELVARFALPEGTRVHTTDVVVPREDLTRRFRMDTAIPITSLLIPTLTNAKGLRDAWVFIVPLRHTFFATAGEDMDEAIEAEVKRMAAAREMTPLEYLDLFPGRDERTVRLKVVFHRGGSAEIKKGHDVKKRIAEQEAKRHSIAILESVAEPMHAGLMGQRPHPFPLREKEIDMLRSLLAADERASTLIVGRERVGKTGLFRAWLEQEFELNRPRFVFATSGARLIAGMSGFGQWQERVRRVMEAAHRIDAILYFDDLGDLFTDRPGGHVDLPSAMRPFLEDGRVRVVGEIREDTLERVEAQNGGFFSCFGRVRLTPMDAKGALHVLAVLTEEDRTREPERPVLSPEANTALVELSERYLPYESFPGKAVRLASELRAAKELALGSEAAGAVLDKDDVHEAFSIRTGVPQFLLRDETALRVDDVFASLSKRLIGQDLAVRRVAELVCVVKAGLQPTGKPLATLLFVGPTGVGKTELARALAELLFGSDERLTRFDMSEYASAEATERLFRGVDGGEGLLTRRVREQPFSVVLLDEIEKAHPAAFDLLLQICGEGRLTDGRGKVAWFQNTILILTSNLGASHRRGKAGFAEATAADDAAHYTKVVRETFRPELVNRIDRIVAFRTLDAKDIHEVTRITTARASRRRGIVERGLELVVSESALQHLGEGGLSDAYGARALRRHVERELVTPLARLISGWGGLEGEQLCVATAGERTEPGEEGAESHGGMRFGVVRQPARRGGNAAHVLAAVMRMRRIMHRQLVLPGIVKLKDETDYLVAQLGYGSGKKKSKEQQKGGQELAMMSADQARFAALHESLVQSFAEICAIEELALTGFVAGQSIDGLRAEAEAAQKRFRGALVHALVAQEPRRNSSTLLVKELDSRRAFDRWLSPLLLDAARRKWTITVHLDGDKEPAPSGVAWPAGLRWGPPRTPDQALARIQHPDRSFRNVIVRAEGDHAGMWLALESGLHRFVGFSQGDPACLHVDLLALRAEVHESEWTIPELEPPNAQAAEGLSRGPALRQQASGEDTVKILDGRAAAQVPADEYWPSFEEIALEHLLLFERDDSLDRDTQLRSVLNDRFREVRRLARENKISAIKLYREITGVGLKDAKDAVEAME